MTKYHLTCVACGYKTPDFGNWFEQNQQCPQCGSKHAEVVYQDVYADFASLLKKNRDSFWSYAPYLPMQEDQQCYSFGEGAVPIEQWSCLEAFAMRQYGKKIQVYAVRNDLNGGTGTFKDVAASLAASVLKANGISNYCVASTGNTAVSYSLYLSLAGISCSIFIPETALDSSEAMISAYGQKVFRVKGDYAKAKELAQEYAKKHRILISTGNIDPLRIEAKKTLVFECIRQLGGMPDVYIQAVSGGTGPLALDKGFREISHLYPEMRLPRMVLAQPSACDPMSQAWQQASEQQFPLHYERNYPIIDNPPTTVPTLSTGNPTTYPLLAPLLKKSGGTFLTIEEEKLIHYARIIAAERKILLGPASAVCLGGFFEALKKDLLKDGERVLINLGEGVRRAPDFVQKMMQTSHQVQHIEECELHDMDEKIKALWRFV